jgi:hypothetical protein
MLIVALVLAVISLAALVTAVVTSNELIAWACIGFSALGVLLLIVDAIRDRTRRPVPAAGTGRTPSTPEAVLGAETTEVMAPVANTYADAVDVAEDVGVEEIDVEEIRVEDIGADADVIVEDYPDEVVYDDPEHDEPSDDEPDYPIAAEEAAVHVISAEEFLAQEHSAEAQSDVEPSVELDDSGSYTVVYTDESPGTAVEEPSYIVTETPTVSYAETSSDDSVIVIYSSETEADHAEDSEEEQRDGER